MGSATSLLLPDIYDSSRSRRHQVLPNETEMLTQICGPCIFNLAKTASCPYRLPQPVEHQATERSFPWNWKESPITISGRRGQPTPEELSGVCRLQKIHPQGQFLQTASHHPPAHKTCVFITLMDRADGICYKVSQASALQSLRFFLRNNDYTLQDIS
jgi:hypothetical protein